MIDVDQALALVLEHAQRRPAVAIPLGEALGCVLAKDVASDLDSPPHDKALVDGYAVCSADLADGQAVLEVVEEVTAGEVPQKTVVCGTATRIMTGAPIPPGADSVVMVEHTELVADEGGASRVRIGQPGVAPGQHIMARAASHGRGQVVVTAGRVIRPVEVGVLAEAGCGAVWVWPRPSVGVLPTGNELVAAEWRPRPGQIRNSNGPMLEALVAQAGGWPVNLGIARDELDDLRRRIGQGLQRDVLVLSGGVSAGVLDLVPQVLGELGVVEIFHRVRLKPGKPLWFGVLNGPGRPHLVFGLPGNPVSSLVCFELFVRPALRKLGGHPDATGPAQTARLLHPHQQRGDRPTWLPAVLQQRQGQPTVELVAWQGSADLAALARANCLVHFPAGDRHFPAGAPLETRGL